ncbi:MAG TPA: EamA family transporter [Gemmatimonadaceae bacterium]|nr:EamA family transporter [Gemmatimonadaceae bacterium]
MTGSSAPSRSKIIAAFAAIYIIWGSTYLAIRFALETLPPFSTAGVRFLISGAILYAWARSRADERPTRLHWRNAGVVGACLLLGGNGGVMWAEQYVPSGIAALLVAILPFWMVLIDWARPGGTLPGRGVMIGLLVGLIGLVVLVGPDALSPTAESKAAASAGNGVQLGAAIVLILASLAWAIGSIFSRHATLPRSAILATGMEMLTGGALLLIVGLITREPMHFDPAGVSAKSLMAFIYLTTFGSLIGFTAYIWLLDHAPPARVATYAYVNPVVAVFLGWALAGEELSVRTAIAAAIIIGAVAVITTARSASHSPEPA